MTAPGSTADLRMLVRLAAEEPAVVSVLGRRDAVLAVPEPARALVLGAVAEASERRPVVVATPTTAEADRLAHDLTAYLGAAAVASFPAWETLPFERVSPTVEAMGHRLRTMWRLRRARDGDAGPDTAPRVVVAPVRALVQRLGPHVEDLEPIAVHPGASADPSELVEALVGMGYRREYQVEHRGEVAVRGSIVDVYPSTGDVPVRIDVWGDEVDRLTEFSVDDQRSAGDLDGVEIFPARELLATGEVRERAVGLVAGQPWGRDQWERLAEGLTFDGMESWLPWLTDEEHLLFDLVGPDGLVVLVEPRRLRDRAADLLAEEEDLAGTLATTWGAAGVDFPRLHLPFDRLLTHTDAPVWSVTGAPEGPDAPAVRASGWGSGPGGAEVVVGQARDHVAAGGSLVVAADGEGSAVRLRELLAGHGIDVSPPARPSDLIRPGAHLVVAPLERGALLSEVGLAVLTESEVTGRRRAHRSARPRRRRTVGVVDDLQPGDHVVHEQHGVARYGGMVTRGIGGTERDYLLLEYRGDDKVYVPTDQIDLVRPYSGGENPSLSRLGGAEWSKTRAKVRAEVDRIAQELVVLYQRRVTAEGRAFPGDTPWQAELESSFPFEETPDQLTAVADVKSDMESPHPMDRLVCGDVGFGKTEVAIRAVFKAVQDGTQAAVLVPTTLLAQQHGQTFADRFAGYPVRVEVLSRFLTPGQQREVIAGVTSGAVDVVIGTHRLLSEDVAFHRLGLLVVDEEQRFGVHHKERIKQLKADVDVLTLTATPIPRTLEMSLTGIRDLSLLQTPPADRQPILTYVGEQDDRAVAEAVRRELLREGQVFFVHNRVQDIDQVATRVRELVPEARVAIAHGQMDEGTLEKVVLEFWEGDHDVLVCTTIVESGIDMPTVNTLVVDRADLLGLGQLHQLRGRVGRAGQRAYAYLFFPPDRSLSEEAYERLRTIGESTELGSGFRIAMRDLEIRGAGNLLGVGQSGHVAAVGYDLYCQMVNEAVRELSGQEPEEGPAEVNVEMPLDAHLPRSYVAKEDLRLEAYRRLAAVASDAEVADIRAEWEDRYGPPPEPAEALLAVAGLRAACVMRGIAEVSVTKGAGLGSPRWTARLSPVVLRPSKQARLARTRKGAAYKEDLHVLVLPVSSAALAPVELVEALDELVPSDAATPGAADDPAGGRERSPAGAQG